MPRTRWRATASSRTCLVSIHLCTFVRAGAWDLKSVRLARRPARRSSGPRDRPSALSQRHVCMCRPARAVFVVCTVSYCVAKSSPLCHWAFAFASGGLSARPLAFTYRDADFRGTSDGGQSSSFVTACVLADTIPPLDRRPTFRLAVCICRHAWTCWADAVDMQSVGPAYGHQRGGWYSVDAP